MTESDLRLRMERLLDSIEYVAARLAEPPIGDADAYRAAAYRSCARWLREALAPGPHRGLAEPADTRVHGVVDAAVTELLLDVLPEGARHWAVGNRTTADCRLPTADCRREHAGTCSCRACAGEQT